MNFLKMQGKLLLLKQFQTGAAELGIQGIQLHTLILDVHSHGTLQL